MSNAASKDEGVHRLKDMLVEEVSLVDRAANKRRFALVKRSPEMSKKVVSDGRGGFTIAKAAGEDEDEETMKAKAPPFGGDAGNSPEEDEDEDKEETEEEKAKKAAHPPFGGNKAPPFGGKPGGKPAADEEEDDKKKTPPPFPPKKSEKAEGDEDEEKSEAKKALSVITPALEKLVGVAKDLRDKGSCSKADFEGAVSALAGMLGGKVEKRGARMAKERLERFQKAIDMLGTILKELIAARDEVAEGGEDKAKKTKTAKSDSDQVAKLTAEVERLRKATGVGNAAPVGERAPTKKSADDDWPLDMNAPKAKSGLSFADD